MLTPKYGKCKQRFYRDPVSSLIQDYIGARRGLCVATLGGAFCLENSDSIERRLLDERKGLTLAVVEFDAPSVRHLLKSLTKVRKEKRAHCIVYVSEFKGNTVEIWHGALKTYFKHCVRMARSHDVIIADYFKTFNFNVEKDTRLVTENKLLKKGGLYFITTSESREDKNRPACQRIMRCDPTGRNYDTALRNFVRRIFKPYKKAQVNVFSYKNYDVSLISKRMYVSEIVV